MVKSKFILLLSIFLFCGQLCSMDGSASALDGQSVSNKDGLLLLLFKAAHVVNNLKPKYYSDYDPEKHFICEYCYGCYNKDYRQQHEIFCRKKSFVCQRCYKHFNYESDCNKHMRNTCPKKFKHFEKKSR